MPWLIVRLKGQSFALPIREVRELIMKPQITAVPETPAFVRGVINIRGQVLPVIDLRQRLGMTPVTDESDAFCPLMDQRRQDHVNWLNELEASSRERREFKLATDPHHTNALLAVGTTPITPTTSGSPICCGVLRNPTNRCMPLREPYWHRNRKATGREP